jgi:uncharacterized protein (DUF2147 family)
MKQSLSCLLAGALLVTGASALATDLKSPLGLWKNIDDVSGKPKALIRISEVNGSYQGKIEKLFQAPGQEPNPLCSKCTDEHHNQPIIGMVFMWGLKKDGGSYSGGQILDPENGEIYRSRMSLVDGGRKLSVSGYIGMPLIGRSQVWLRQHEDATPAAVPATMPAAVPAAAPAAVPTTTPATMPTTTPTTAPKK